MKKGERKPFGWQEPWEREGDLKEWVVRGYRCCAVRHPMLGCWLLYLGVPQGHPWYACGSDEIDADVHGGVSWTGRPIPLHPLAYDGGRILWWVGADFGHLGDQCPMLVKKNPLLRAGSRYRTLAYVQHEAERLAHQAEQAARAKSNEGA